jgi:hypothetical protein
VGTPACSQNAIEGERIKLSLKREKTSQYVWPSTYFFFALEITFALLSPSSHGQRSNNTFVPQPPFLLGANGRKCDREHKKNLYFF